MTTFAQAVTLATETLSGAEAKVQPTNVCIEALGKPPSSSSTVRASILCYEVLASVQLVGPARVELLGIEGIGNVVAPSVLVNDLPVEVIGHPESPYSRCESFWVEVLSSVEEVTGSVQGGIDVDPPEAIHEEDWVVSIYSANDPALVKVGHSFTQTYSEDGLNPLSSYMVMALPNTGHKWSAGSTTVIGDKTFSTMPESVPYIYKATQSGVTGIAEPEWPTVVGGTVVDGGVVWQNIGQMIKPGMKGPLYAPVTL